jgi:hypothetical protein
MLKKVDTILERGLCVLIVQKAVCGMLKLGIDCLA